MDRFQEMQVFVRIAERGSFTQAAEDLQIPRATVTNLLKRMEARIGTRLLERTTRTVTLTDDGKRFYRNCVRLLADMEEAENQFRNTVPKGLLRVNMQGTLAKNFVVPALGDFMARYPDIRLQISEDDRFVDLVREGIHCVLRAGNLQDSSMVGRRVTQLEQITVASPGYLEKYGVPESLEELAGHYAVNYISSATGRAMPLEFVVGDEVKIVQLPELVAVNGADLYTAASLAGMGIVQIPRYRVLQELEEKKLAIVLPELLPPPIPVSVLYPQNRHLSQRVRVFVDWISEIFQYVR
ncbi:LysR family transcriptional regulator [Pantoea sp. BAV 3049]|uniref:LysR family transcriptional regulator n=1 Tax=Pantoea sp. BAV 3049 TaxID=2654188 RepID=UPI00131A7F2F|nr:LysR family transcriptional regulator [Pantoea sp. BAV 3049]